jgi:hypothetical protein
MIKDFKSFVFVSVDVKGLTDAFFVSVDVKGLSCIFVPLTFWRRLPWRLALEGVKLPSGRLAITREEVYHS